MGIDPLMYERISGKSADPTKRLGEVLAKNAKKQQERDELPKGFRGGLRTVAKPWLFSQIWLFWKNARRARD